jgi:hypothetical protein
MKNPDPVIVKPPRDKKKLNREEPKSEFGTAQCPECNRSAPTRKVAGDRIFCNHKVSDFPTAHTCGMSGQRVERVEQVDKVHQRT